MTFAEKLNQLRTEAGLTQEQLADRSGINLWTIRGYEQGRREPGWKGMLALSSALGVAAEVFAECEESSAAEGAQANPKPRGRPRKPDPADAPAPAPDAGKGKAAGGKGKTRKAKGE